MKKSSSLPLNLTKANDKYLILEKYLSELDFHYESYVKADEKFRKVFLKLFNDTASDFTTDHRWRLILQLGEMVKRQDLVQTPLLSLQQNNDRAAAALLALSVILKQNPQT